MARVDSIIVKLGGPCGTVSSTEWAARLPYAEGIDEPAAAVAAPIASQMALGTEYDSSPSSRPLKPPVQ